MAIYEFTCTNPDEQHTFDARISDHRERDCARTCGKCSYPANRRVFYPTPHRLDPHIEKALGF